MSDIVHYTHKLYDEEHSRKEIVPIKNLFKILPYCTKLKYWFVSLIPLSRCLITDSSKAVTYITFMWVSDDSNYSAESAGSFTQPTLNFKKLKGEKGSCENESHVAYCVAWPHFVPYETGHRNLVEREGGNLSPKSLDSKRNWVAPQRGQLCRSTVFWHGQLEKWWESKDKWEAESRLQKRI